MVFTLAFVHTGRLTYLVSELEAAYPNRTTRSAEPTGEYVNQGQYELNDSIAKNSSVLISPFSGIPSQFLQDACMRKCVLG